MVGRRLVRVPANTAHINSQEDSRCEEHPTGWVSFRCPRSWYFDKPCTPCFCLATSSPSCSKDTPVAMAIGALTISECPADGSTSLWHFGCAAGWKWEPMADGNRCLSSALSAFNQHGSEMCVWWGIKVPIAPKDDRCQSCSQDLFLGSLKLRRSLRQCLSPIKILLIL